jgi:hypothetical protein
VKANRENQHSDVASEARQEFRSAEARGRARDTELEARGLLPTEESPVLLRTAGKTGFGLFLYLEEGLDLQTLDRLAKHTDRAGLIRRALA